MSEDHLNREEILKELHDSSAFASGSFVDPEFPHVDSSLGNCTGRDLIKGWRAAAELNPEAGLFEGGTDPDDVHQGYPFFMVKREIKELECRIICFVMCKKGEEGEIYIIIEFLHFFF